MPPAKAGFQVGDELINRRSGFKCGIVFLHDDNGGNDIPEGHFLNRSGEVLLLKDFLETGETFEPQKYREDFRRQE